MSHRTTITHDGEGLIHSDTIEAPCRWAVEVWERARATRGRRSCSSSPSARPRGRPARSRTGLTVAGFAVVRRPPETALERFEEALDATLSHGLSPRDSGLDRVGDDGPEFSMVTWPTPHLRQSLDAGRGHVLQRALIDHLGQGGEAASTVTGRDTFLVIVMVSGVRSTATLTDGGPEALPRTRWHAQTHRVAPGGP